MIIIKDIPGLTQRETLDALLDIIPPGAPQVSTGHGGFVVDEDTAARFLAVYLIAAGKRKVPVPPKATIEKPTPRAVSASENIRPPTVTYDDIEPPVVPDPMAPAEDSKPPDSVTKNPKRPGRPRATRRRA